MRGTAIRINGTCSVGRAGEGEDGGAREGRVRGSGYFGLPCTTLCVHLIELAYHWECTASLGSRLRPQQYRAERIRREAARRNARDHRRWPRVDGRVGEVAGGVPGFGGSAGRGSGVRALGKEARERGMTFLPSVLRRRLGVAGSRHGQPYIYAMLAQPDPAHSPICLRALSHTPPPPPPR